MIFIFVHSEEFFPDTSSRKEATIDVGKMKDVAQEPSTPAEALKTFLAGVDPETYKRRLEFC